MLLRSIVCRNLNRNSIFLISNNIMSKKTLNLKSLSSNRQTRSTKPVDDSDLTTNKSEFFTSKNEDNEKDAAKVVRKTRSTKSANKSDLSSEKSDFFDEDDKKKKVPKVQKSRAKKSKNDSDLSLEKSDFFDTKDEEHKVEEETKKVKKKRTPVKVKSDDENAKDSVNEPTLKKEKWVPVNWEETLNNIREMRKHQTAPVDEMGCHKCADPNANEVDIRFQSLVALMLSSQTKDQVTHTAMTNLIEHGCTAESMSNIPDEQLERLIYPVGFYKRKVTYIKRTAEILKRKYNGDIPKTVKELCDLPGVGPKMAHICMKVAWGEVSGIGVDTHVHRISNRLKWVPKETKNPEDTRKALEDWLPQELWGEVNHLLVGFGQEICLPQRPKCTECLNRNICPFFKSTKSIKA